MVESISASKKTIAFDLDGVLCAFDGNNSLVGFDKYSGCKPMEKFIKLINSCYDNGHYIVVYTARGMNTSNGNIGDVYDELYTLTKNQLGLWGIKHHRLIMGKLNFDLLIDDKAVCSKKINSITDINEILGIGEKQ